MRSQQVLGLAMLLVGLVLLYLLRGVLIQLILLVIGFIGVLLALILVFVGLGMIFFRGRERRWSL